MTHYEMIRTNYFYFNGAPGAIRTPDLLIRSQMLYPAELRVRGGDLYNVVSYNFQPISVGFENSHSLLKNFGQFS